MQLLITGIHPDQIEDIETMLIEMFDGTGDLGLNSQTGRKNKILKNLDVDSEQEDDVDDEDVDEEKENEGVDDLFHKRKKGPKEDDDKGGSNFGSSCIGFSSAIAVSS